MFCMVIRGVASHADMLESTRLTIGCSIGARSGEIPLSTDGSKLRVLLVLGPNLSSAGPSCGAVLKGLLLAVIRRGLVDGIDPF